MFNRTEGTQIFVNGQEEIHARDRSRRLQRDCMRTLGGMGKEIVREVDPHKVPRSSPFCSGKCDLAYGIVAP